MLIIDHASPNYDIKIDFLLPFTRVKRWKYTPQRQNKKMVGELTISIQYLIVTFQSMTQM